MSNYEDPSKNIVRETMLGRAITALTTGRHESELIERRELTETFEHFLNLISKALKSDHCRDPAEAELREWFEFDAHCNSPRQPGELKVLYLCGPSPVNDLEVLLENGINIHNVWALTSSAKDSKIAHAQLAEYHLPLKIHEGSLAEFFEIYNEVFDLIYFDACGPFMGGSPSTLTPLLAIFEMQRLAPKGALITNYSGPPDAGPARERYVDLTTAYFHPRYNDIPDVVSESGLDPADFAIQPHLLHEFTSANLEAIYSDLVTNLTIDLAAVMIPNLRTFTMPAFLKKHSGNKETVEALIARQTNPEVNDDGFPGDARLAPGSYPILSFITKLEEYNKADPLLQALSSHNRQGNSFKHFLSVSELTARVIEGNWRVLSPELLAALKCSWFDYEARLTCDVPLPNLIINSIIGTYGRPYFYNSRQSLRLKYKSNVREMYCDLFVFDQCRSFFDWFPTVQACPSRFRSIPFQIVARCIIDRLCWSNFYNTANPFRGAAIGGIGEIPAAKPLIIPERTFVD